MTFDAVTWLIARMDRMLEANQALREQCERHGRDIEALQKQVSSLVGSWERFSQALRLLLPLLVLILAGLVALGPEETIKLIKAAVKFVL